tara:strand:+ start:1108 stop:1683 length:576 start_codon:yes stop_codon:yes gene_type:complete
MELKKGQLYFHQSKYGANWIKVTSIGDEYTSIIKSINAESVKDVKVDTMSDFMDKKYYHRNTSHVFLWHKDLDKQLTEEEKWNINIPWFNTYQEEIDGDHSGDIECWMRFHKLEYRWDVKKMPVHSSYTSNYIQTNFLLNHSELLIPFENIEQFSEIVGSRNTDVFPYVYGILGDELKRLQRDIFIDQVLS